MKRSLELKYDEVVIGSDLEALLYSYIKKVPLIFVRHKKPYKYINEKNYENSIELWDYLMFTLSLGGYIPFSNMIQSIRLEDENTIKIATKENFSSIITYKKLLISDDYGINNIPQPYGKTDVNNLVVDFMAICQRNTHYSQVGSFKKNDHMMFDVNFTNKYVLDRKHTLIISKSIISDEQLKNDEYGESYIRLRFLREMYPKIKEVKHIKREIYNLGKNLYELPSNITLLNDSNINNLLSGEVQNANFSKLERILHGTNYKE